MREIWTNYLENRKNGSTRELNINGKFLMRADIKIFAAHYYLLKIITDSQFENGVTCYKTTKLTVA